MQPAPFDQMGYPGMPGAGVGVDAGYYGLDQILPVGEEPQNPCRLIVNYLPSNLTADGFRNLFSAYGNIMNCKLVTNRHNGASLGYGFVEYSQAEEAAGAIRSLNGRKIENKTLKVSYARNPSPEIKNSNVYISGLHQDLTQDQLEQMFRPFGTILTSKLLRDAKGKSRCVGFVRMSRHVEAVNAVGALNGQQYLGKTLTVKIESSTDKAVRQQSSGGMRGIGSGAGSIQGHDGYFQNARASGGNGQAQGQAGQGFCVFVYNVPHGDEEHFLRLNFGQFGEILNVYVPRDTHGMSKLYGFVTFRTYDSARNAIMNLNKFPVNGRFLQVSLKTEKGLVGPMGLGRGSAGPNIPHGGSGSGIGGMQVGGMGYGGYAQYGVGMGQQFGGPGAGRGQMNPLGQQDMMQYMNAGRGGVPLPIGGYGVGQGSNINSGSMGMGMNMGMYGQRWSGDPEDIYMQQMGGGYGSLQGYPGAVTGMNPYGEAGASSNSNSGGGALSSGIGGHSNTGSSYMSGRVPQVGQDSSQIGISSNSQGQNSSSNSSSVQNGWGQLDSFPLPPQIQIGAQGQVGNDLDGQAQQGPSDGEQITSDQNGQDGSQ